MASDVQLACRCGRVRGVALAVTPRSSGHVVCYCVDCKAYARWLGTPGIMNDRGGTDVFQVPPARLRIDEGLDAVACVRLSPDGLHRWYAGCCRTPVGNTLGPRVPFVGIVHSFRCGDADGPAPADVLAAPVGIWGKSAPGGVPPGVHPKAPVGVLAMYARKLSWWWITGQARPSPFFDPETGQPRVKPTVLSPSERAALSA